MMLEYLEMTRDEIARLDRKTTLFVSVVSPVEVHGGHLPLGTDLFVAQGVLQRTVDRLDGWTAVRLPDLLLGAQAIPAPGSFPVKGTVLEAALLAWGSALAALGFQYWLVFDNHGGVTHHLAEIAAAKKLKRKGLNLTVPFVSIFQVMSKGTTGLGLQPGHDGGVEDAHAGTNETSLMLALSPGRVRDSWKTKQRWKPTAATPMGNLGRKLGQPLLGMCMDWFAAKDNPHYVGCPAEATAEAGELMAEYHVKKSLELLDSASKGDYVPPKVYPWYIAGLSKMFE